MTNNKVDWLHASVSLRKVGVVLVIFLLAYKIHIFFANGRSARKFKNQQRLLIRSGSIRLCQQKPNSSFETVPLKKDYVFRDINTADDIELRVTDLEYSMKFTFLAVNQADTFVKNFISLLALRCAQQASIISNIQCAIKTDNQKTLYNSYMQYA